MPRAAANSFLVINAAASTSRSLITSLGSTATTTFFITMGIAGRRFTSLICTVLLTVSYPSFSKSSDHMPPAMPPIDQSPLALDFCAPGPRFSDDGRMALMETPSMGVPASSVIFPAIRPCPRHSCASANPGTTNISIRASISFFICIPHSPPSIPNPQSSFLNKKWPRARPMSEPGAGRTSRRT